MSVETPSRTVILTGVHPNALLQTKTALAFAKAGYSDICLLGSSQHYLDELKSAIAGTHPDVHVLPQEVDIKSPESIGIASHNIRSKLGAWDAFVHSASPVVVEENSLAESLKVPRTTIRGADEDIWWDAFEKNVRSLHHTARHFFPKMKANASFINVLSVDVASVKDDRNSAQSASQLAAARVVEYLSKENESSGLKMLNVIANGSDLKLRTEFDTAQEVAELIVWCASIEADFISGQTLAAKDGIEKLKQERSNIEESQHVLTVGSQPLDRNR